MVRLLIATCGKSTATATLTLNVVQIDKIHILGREGGEDFVGYVGIEFNARHPSWCRSQWGRNKALTHTMMSAACTEKKERKKKNDRHLTSCFPSFLRSCLRSFFLYPVSNIYSIFTTNIQISGCNADAPWVYCKTFVNIAKIYILHLWITILAPKDGCFF